LVAENGARRCQKDVVSSFTRISMGHCKLPPCSGMACASLNINMDGGARIFAANCEKAMFMKWEGDDFVLHGTFVDAVPTSEKLKEEFVLLYSAEFDVTGGTLMESFVGTEVKQSEEGISLHLNT
jgi:hypothetical protein